MPVEMIVQLARYYNFQGQAKRFQIEWFGIEEIHFEYEGTSIWNLKANLGMPISSGESASTKNLSTVHPWNTKHLKIYYQNGKAFLLKFKCFLSLVLRAL